MNTGDRHYCELLGLTADLVIAYHRMVHEVSILKTDSPLSQCLIGLCGSYWGMIEKHKKELLDDVERMA